MMLKRKTSRLRRGSVMLLFVLVGFPFIFFAAGLSVDVTRIYVANRQVANATQAASLAGAFQFKPNSSVLDTRRAQTIALETWNKEKEVGALPLAQVPNAPVIQVTAGSSASPGKVSVTTTYNVNGLVFAAILGVSSSVNDVTIERSSIVCVPGSLNSPTDGYCRRPAGN